MGSGRESQPARNLLTSYTLIAYKEDDPILFRGGSGAGLLGREAGKERRVSSYTVPFLFVLVLLQATSYIYYSSLIQ